MSTNDEWIASADKRAETCLQLMQQNARQILNIVQGTFPAQSFDVPLDSEDCVVFDSVAQELQCLWSVAKALSTRSDGSGRRGRLDALIAVSPIVWFYQERKAYPHSSASGLNKS